MALFRALEDARPADERLFIDPYARAFVGPRLRWLVTLSALPGVVDLVCRVIDRRWPGARTSAVARTRLIDERVGAAISEGVQQIVLLGGGFDSRPYRLPGCLRLTLFEVDHPSTQAKKRHVVRDVVGDVSSRVRFVPTDFNQDAVETTMAAAGYDPSRPTLFAMGGRDQLPHRQRRGPHAALVRPGGAPSQIVFTYVDRAVLDDPAVFFGTARLFATLEASGERWTFGLDPTQLAASWASAGTVSTKISAPTSIARATSDPPRPPCEGTSSTGSPPLTSSDHARCSAPARGSLARRDRGRRRTEGPDPRDRSVKRPRMRCRGS